MGPKNPWAPTHGLGWVWPFRKTDGLGLALPKNGWVGLGSARLPMGWVWPFRKTDGLGWIWLGCRWVGLGLKIFGSAQCCFKQKPMGPMGPNPWVGFGWVWSFRKTDGMGWVGFVSVA